MASVYHDETCYKAQWLGFQRYRQWLGSYPVAIAEIAMVEEHTYSQSEIQWLGKRCNLDRAPFFTSTRGNRPYIERVIILWGGNKRAMRTYN